MLPVLLVLACTGSPGQDSACAEQTWYQDLDGDGYGDLAVSACQVPDGHAAVGGDCDDGDPTVHPDAIEVCNDLDDDCDGQVDPQGLAGGDPWYPDADSDGFGAADADPLLACDQPAGFLADASDCDDTDADAHPGGTETWYDGVDGDCLGDDDYDADRDGFAAADGGGEDCDDGDSAVHPGAAEICYDGIDQDCDGAASGCPGVGDSGTTTSAWATAETGRSDLDAFGHLLAPAPDLDGDGRPDLLALSLDDVDYGTPLGGTVTDVSFDADGDARVGRLLEISVEPGEEEVYWGLASHTTDTGTGGLLLAATVEVEENALGGTSLVALWAVEGPGVALDTSDAALTFATQVRHDGLGEEGVSLDHDFDVDGNNDLLVFSSSYSDPDAAGERQGAVHIIRGTDAGLVSEDRALFRAIGSRPDTGFGHGGVAADLDGDGADDLIALDGVEHDALVFTGPLSGDLLDSDADYAWDGDADISWGIDLVGMGDVDGDGVPDIAVRDLRGNGEPDATTSAVSGVTIMSGTTRDWQTGDDVLADITVQRLGLAITSAGIHRTGDLDSDGHRDLTVSLTGFNDTDDVAIAVAWGPFEGSSTITLGDVVAPYLPHGWIGDVLADHDVTGDGRADLVISDASYEGPGIIRVYPGSGY